jgi:external thioesterase TEII
LGGYVNSYYLLAQSLDDSIDVWAANPPGHGGSTTEALSDIQILVDAYFEQLKTHIKPGCVFFGHSMGAVVAYFLLQKIMDSDLYPIKPVGIILSACNPPSFFIDPKISSLSHQDFIAHMHSYCVIPEAIIKEQSLMDYFLPVFRADFSVLESAAYSDYKRLNLPVYYIWGDEDNIVPFDAVIQWSKYFKREIKLMTINHGKHMFIHQQVNFVARTIEQILGTLTECPKEVSEYSYAS